MATVATYQIGPPLRPSIRHDNGFLDRFAHRAPTVADRAKYAEWAALLEAAEAAQGIPLIPHNDLPDALAAYRHFLYGRGKDRNFSYDRYVASDSSGRTTLDNAILDLRRGVEALASARPVGALVTGLARQYMNYATLTRMIRWSGVTASPPAVSRVGTRRDQEPPDNRRARNRI
jgi:hypothetical protein